MGFGGSVSCEMCLVDDPSKVAIYLEALGMCFSSFNMFSLFDCHSHCQ